MTDKKAQAYTAQPNPLEAIPSPGKIEKQKKPSYKNFLASIFATMGIIIIFTSTNQITGRVVGGEETNLLNFAITIFGVLLIITAIWIFRKKKV